MLRQNHQELEGNDRYEGFCVDMLKELADILKFKYRIRLVGDGLYGVPGANGTWTGMVGELISRVCKYRRMHRLRCSLQTTINYHIHRIIYTVHVSTPMSKACPGDTHISSHVVHSSQLSVMSYTLFFSWPCQLKHCIFQNSHGLLVACSLSAPFLKPSELTLTDFPPESVYVAAVKSLSEVLHSSSCAVCRG